MATVEATAKAASRTKVTAGHGSGKTERREAGLQLLALQWPEGVSWALVFTFPDLGLRNRPLLPLGTVSSRYVQFGECQS